MYIGDFKVAAVIDLKFTTRSFTTGVPTVLAGTPVISIYKDNNVTQTTTGVTLSVDFDGVVGLNNIHIDTADAFYAAGSNFQCVITTGTVGGVSVVGETVGAFSIEATSALRPTTAGRTLDVTATGGAGIDWANVENPTTALNLSATNIDVDQVVASVSGAVGSVTGAVGSVTGSVGSVTGLTASNLDATISSRATPAQVNAEVVDALSVDTYAEPSGVPPATTTLAVKIGRIYMTLRNQLTVTAAKKQFFNDAGAADWEKDLTDDGTTYTETEGNAP